MFIFLLTAVSAKTQTTLDVGSKSFLIEKHHPAPVVVGNKTPAKALAACPNTDGTEQNDAECACGGLVPGFARYIGTTCSSGQFCNESKSPYCSDAKSCANGVKDCNQSQGEICHEDYCVDFKVLRAKQIEADKPPVKECSNKDGQQENRVECLCGQKTCSGDEKYCYASSVGRCTTEPAKKCPNTFTPNEVREQNDEECVCKDAMCDAGMFCDETHPTPSQSDNLFAKVNKAFWNEEKMGRCTSERPCRSSIECGRSGGICKENGFCSGSLNA